MNCIFASRIVGHPGHFAANLSTDLDPAPEFKSDYFLSFLSHEYKSHGLSNRFVVAKIFEF